MIGSEIVALIGYINRRWPHAPLDENAYPVWLEDLAELPTEECGAAVKRYAKAGERFPPTSGWVFSEVQRHAQMPAPGFEAISAEISRTLTRALAHELYRPSGNFTPEDTAFAVGVMAERGVHEAVLRFVQEVGLREAWLIPHGDQFPLDMGQAADRRNLMRHYRDQSVPGWRADPTPGVALVRARAALEPGRAGGLRPIDPGRHLPEGGE
jgi:hypothetical protein